MAPVFLRYGHPSFSWFLSSTVTSRTCCLKEQVLLVIAFPSEPSNKLTSYLSTCRLRIWFASLIMLMNWWTNSVFDSQPLKQVNLDITPPDGLQWEVTTSANRCKTWLKQNPKKVWCAGHRHPFWARKLWWPSLQAQGRDLTVSKVAIPHRHTYFFQAVGVGFPESPWSKGQRVSTF